MKLIYATKNKAKLEGMQRILAGIGFEITGIEETGTELPEVEENGNDPLENAEIKARAYYKVLRKPLFSCDSGLFFEGLPPELQPGINVRNINGRRLSDDEMIEYYSGLAKANGGQIIGQYLNGICLVVSENEVYKHSGADISYGKFILADKPHNKRNEGFPLDSLSIHIDSGKYYYDLENGQDAYKLISDSDIGYRGFFLRSLKPEGRA